MVTAEGRQVEGRVIGDRASGFRFRTSADGRSIPLEGCPRVLFRPSGPAVSSPGGPFQVHVGARGRISGRLGRVTRTEVILEAGPSGQPVTIARSGVRALTQRKGEVQVLADGFERIDTDRWVVTGQPELSDQAPAEGRRSLRLPGGGNAVVYHPGEPIDSGRLELAFRIQGEGRHAGQSAVVELTFRDSGGRPESLQVLLGWEDELLGVRTSGAGPPLAIQPLRSEPGWHRLTARFQHDRTDVAIDGDELAHGEGFGGPLMEVRLATASARGRQSDDLGLLVDDLRLARFTAADGPFDADPAQDEVRLVHGDQIFGAICSATAQEVVCDLDERTARLPWSEIAGLYFRRVPDGAKLLDGEWVRVSWRDAPGGTREDRDEVEGVLDEAAEDEIVLLVPHVGPLHVPRGQLVELVPLGRHRRLLIDSNSHHVGNALIADLDPPQPEGGVLEIPFRLESVPEGPAALVLDVVQVVGVEGDPDFSRRVRDGELLTRAILNDRAFDTLNRHVTARNDAPLRIRLPIPPGVLQTGPNLLRLEQSGLKDDPETLDNLGILGVAVEWPTSHEASKP
jgi:hypothetical protein